MDNFTYIVNDGFVDSAPSTISLSLKNDPLYQYQWHLNNAGQSNFAYTSGSPGADVNASGAITAGYTGEGVVVAVVDSGLEIAHEDLADNVVADPMTLSAGTRIRPRRVVAVIMVRRWLALLRPGLERYRSQRRCTEKLPERLQLARKSKHDELGVDLWW